MSFRFFDYAEVPTHSKKAWVLIFLFHLDSDLWTKDLKHYLKFREFLIENWFFLHIMLYLDPDPNLPRCWFGVWFHLFLNGFGTKKLVSVRNQRNWSRDGFGSESGSTPFRSLMSTIYQKLTQSKFNQHVILLYLPIIQDMLGST